MEPPRTATRLSEAVLRCTMLLALAGLGPALARALPGPRAELGRLPPLRGDTGSSLFGGGLASSATRGSLLLLPWAAASPPLVGLLLLRDDVPGAGACLVGVLRPGTLGSGDTLRASTRAPSCSWPTGCWLAM